MGDFDAPALVDYIRSTTNREFISYVGHSQGSTQILYAIASNQTFWQKRLNGIVAMAPVTRIDGTSREAELIWVAEAMQDEVS